jgi:transposase
VSGRLQRQLRLEDFLAGVSTPLRPTVTVPTPGWTVQTTVSPGSSPSNAATGSGTVVRRESDLANDFTAFDSNDLVTGDPPPKRVRSKRNVGQCEGRHVGTNAKYSSRVGQYVGQQMINLPERTDSRDARAIERLRSGVRAGETATPGEFLVPSQSGKGFHRVHGISIPGELESCDCADFAGRNSDFNQLSERVAPCWHIYFARHWCEDPPTWNQVSVRKPRNWGLEDQAKLAEGRIIRVLLRDLSNGFPEPYKDPTRAGRKPVPLRDQAYCAVQRSYYGDSLRDSHEYREIAVEKGLLSSPHSYSLPSHFLLRDDVTAGLHDMLARSSIPLIGLDRSCAVDSTGLRTTRFHSYRKEKYEPSRENVWLKLHALVGVNSHVIPVLEVTSGSSGDSPQFEPLLRRARSVGFEFEEAYADKAYNSRANFNVCDELKVVPFIPFKISQTGETKGSPLYHKMFLFWQSNPNEAWRHYGQRAQVESTFSNFKARLGETLASKKFVSQVNEVLCMAIAHNMRVLVRQMFLSGTFPDFLRPMAPEPISAKLPEHDATLFLNHENSGLPVPQWTFSR